MGIGALLLTYQTVALQFYDTEQSIGIFCRVFIAFARR